MSILQINFKLNVAPAEYRKICSSVAQPIADVPGLVWKVWMLSEQDGEAGGIYLFQDRQSLDAYLSGPIIRQIKSLPQLREISTKWFEAIPELTVVTRGPIFRTSNHLACARLSFKASASRGRKRIQSQN